MKKLVLALTLVLFLGSASAYNFSTSNEVDTESYESMINDQTEDAPAFLSGLMGNQTVNLAVETDDGNTTAGAEIEGLTLTELNESGYEDPDIEIVTDQETIENISESERPFDAALNEFEDGDITYSTEGFWNNLKLSIAESFLKG